MSTIVTRYTIPESMRNGTGMPAKVGLRSLTSREEIDASKIGGFDMLKTQYEAVKRAICELDGKKVTVADVDLEKFWEMGGSPVRSLLLQAYNRLSSPTDSQASDFFGSAEVVVE